MSAFATEARQRVRTALELATQRSPENASRIAAELRSLSTEAGALGLVSIRDLAQRGSEQARVLDRDQAAVIPCVRTLRELARALDGLEAKPAVAHVPAPRATGR